MRCTAAMEPIPPAASSLICTGTKWKYWQHLTERVHIGTGGGDKGTSQQSSSSQKEYNHHGYNSHNCHSCPKHQYIIVLIIIITMHLPRVGSSPSGAAQRQVPLWCKSPQYASVGHKNQAIWVAICLDALKLSIALKKFLQFFDKGWNIMQQEFVHGICWIMEKAYIQYVVGICGRNILF